MISVIIPTYNGLDMLRKSLPTWFSQTLPTAEFEVIVVDNRSSDNTRQYVESLLMEHPNLVYLYEPNPGATNARHAGAHKAIGEYFVFADNDGLFNPECLASILEVYKANKECAAVACRIDIIWDGDEPKWIKPYKYLLGQLNYGEEIRYNNHNHFFLNGGLMSVRKDVFERLGGFNPDLIGPYLIGDGDLGFVNKLHAEHALIGWAPNARMQHMQLVAKHGSKRGIALHCYNNGIADSYAKYRTQGLEILDFPCNQFGSQAPGSTEEITEVCRNKWLVPYQIFDKIDVNGENADPLFEYLKNEQPFTDITGKGATKLKLVLKAVDRHYKDNNDIKWNFTKFLVDREGNVVRRFEPTEDLGDVKAAIKDLL